MNERRIPIRKIVIKQHDEYEHHACENDIKEVFDQICVFNTKLLEQQLSNLDERYVIVTNYFNKDDRLKQITFELAYKLIIAMNGILRSLKLLNYFIIRQLIYPDSITIQLVTSLQEELQKTYKDPKHYEHFRDSIMSYKALHKTTVLPPVCTPPQTPKPQIPKQLTPKSLPIKLIELRERNAKINGITHTPTTTTFIQPPLQIYTYESLIELVKSSPTSLYPFNYEKHLSTQDFENIFQMTQEQFYQLKPWHRNQLKQKKLLF